MGGASQLLGGPLDAIVEMLGGATDFGRSVGDALLPGGAVLLVQLGGALLEAVDEAQALAEELVRDMVELLLRPGPSLVFTYLVWGEGRFIDCALTPGGGAQGEVAEREVRIVGEYEVAAAIGGGPQ